jgi:hypothetical protein
MEAVRTSETSVYSNETTQRYITVGCHLLSTTVVKTPIHHNARYFHELANSQLLRTPFHVITEVKVKLSRYHHAGAKEGSNKLLFILDLCITWGVNDQRHAPAALHPRETNLGTHWTGDCVGLRAGWSGHRGQGNNILPLLGSKLGPPICS